VDAWTPDPSHPRSVRSQLLLGGPHLIDPNFFRTVVLVLEHNAEGAFGLVVNRPLDIRVVDIVEGWDGVPGADVVHAGGPVSPDTGFGLALIAPGFPVPEGVRPILGELHAVDLSADPAFVVPALASLRIFAGYSGWSPGQLDDELERLGWLVVDGRPTDAFCTKPETQWSDVLRRQPGELKRLADYPLDPQLN